MKTERTEVDPPAPDPCAACPWLTKNHRKPHPEAYYSDANRRRLWSGLRTGDAPGMTCHPTDPENQPVKESVRTRECAGAWTLIMRELKVIEDVEFPEYRKGRKLAMTREGAMVALGAVLPPPFGRGLSGTKINNSPGVSLGLGTGR